MQQHFIEVDQFFSLQSLSTLAGASGATWVVANTLWLALGLRPALTGFLISQAICHGLVMLSGSTILLHAIAFVNGCLVFMTAVGGAALAAPKELADAASRGIEPGRRFRTPWI